MSPRDKLKIREKLGLEELRKRLLKETTELGHNARFVGAGLEIKPLKGTPNWDANIGVAPAVVHKTFLRVVGELKNKFDILW